MPCRHADAGNAARPVLLLDSSYDDKDAITSVTFDEESTDAAEPVIINYTH